MYKIYQERLIKLSDGLSKITSLVCIYFRLLLRHGADSNILTEDGERPIDLVEPTDMATIKVMLENQSSKSHDSSEDELEERARKKYGVIPTPVLTG